MSTKRKTRMVKTGNSYAIRIPKAWLDQLNVGAEVELRLEVGQIVIGTGRPAWQGWDEHFRQMAAAGDDALLDAPVATQWEAEEWQW